jgi:hypothetical protein
MSRTNSRGVSSSCIPALLVVEFYLTSIEMRLEPTTSLRDPKLRTTYSRLSVNIYIDLHVEVGAVLSFSITVLLTYLLHASFTFEKRS